MRRNESNAVMNKMNRKIAKRQQKQYEWERFTRRIRKADKNLLHRQVKLYLARLFLYVSLFIFAIFLVSLVKNHYIGKAEAQVLPASSIFYNESNGNTDNSLISRGDVADKKSNKTLVVIDPGHGGRDPGTCYDPEKLYEKDIVLDMAFRLKSILEKEGIETLMTRTTDVELDESVVEDLAKRAAIANSKDATVFVSIHVNSEKDKSFKGTQVFYYGTEPINGLSSERFSVMMKDEFEANESIPYDGRGKQNFKVLRDTNMPAVLIETAFISNTRDRALLKSDDFRNKIMQSSANAIIKAITEMGAEKKNGEWIID